MNNKKKFKFIIAFIIFSSILSNISYAENIFEITAKKVLYKNNDKVIIADGQALATDNKGKNIFADKIIYYKNKNLIKTFGNSKYQDGKNILKAQNFIYDLQSKTIEATNNVVLLDEENNKFFFKKFKYFENKQIGIGNKAIANISDGSYISSSRVETNKKNGETILDNAKYTTCKNIYIKNKFCPSWSLESKKLIHDKNKKTLTHKNAVLKIKNIPILYTPYISHPDPSVKRKSGFLVPTFKTINAVGKTFNAPYFWAASKDQDFIFKPIIYFDQHDALLTSYRKALKKGFLRIENGYTKGYKNSNDKNKTDGSRNYFFLSYEQTKENGFLNNSNLDLKIQRISQENYVRVNKINTPLFKEDINILENSFKISKFDEKYNLNFKIGVFENINSNDSNKYTYYLPEGSYSQNFDNKNFNINFNSYFEGRKFLKNQRQGKIKNVITLNTKSYNHKNSGLSTLFKNNIYNNNIYNRNVTGQKENLNVDNYFTTAIESTWPLAKFSKGKKQAIVPKIFTKFTNGKMQDSSSDNKTFLYSDIFSMNRTNNIDKPETGFSLGYGVDYSILSKKSKNFDNYYKFSTGIGQVINDVHKKEMPTESSLNNKTSDFAGFLKYEFFGDNSLLANNTKNINDLKFFEKNNLTINYDFNLNNDLSKLNRNNLETQFSLNNIYSKLKFSEENMHVGNTRYATLELKKKIKSNYFLSIGSKKNLKNNSSEYHNISYNFENDCLRTYLALSKDFYSNKDLQSSKTLVFGIVIKPFSDSFGPDLSDFIN